MATLDSILDSREARLADAIKLVEAQVNQLLGAMTKGPVLDSERVRLMGAANLYVAIQDAFGPYFTEIKTQAADLGQAAIGALPAGTVLSAADVSIISAWADAVTQQLDALAQGAIADLSSLVYAGAITGTSTADLAKQIAEKLGDGKKFSADAKMLAHDGYMSVDSIITLRKAAEIGSDRFKYVGSLIADSRQWCVDHQNKVLTREEIEQWRNQTWAGKRPGDPFIVRGGYNCRHHFRVVQGD